MRRVLVILAVEIFILVAAGGACLAAQPEGNRTCKTVAAPIRALTDPQLETLYYGVIESFERRGVEVLSTVVQKYESVGGDGLDVFYEVTFGSPFFLTSVYKIRTVRGEAVSSPEFVFTIELPELGPTAAPVGASNSYLGSPVQTREETGQTTVLRKAPLLGLFSAFGARGPSLLKWKSPKPIDFDLVAAQRLHELANWPDGTHVWEPTYEEWVYLTTTPRDGRNYLRTDSRVQVVQSDAFETKLVNLSKKSGFIEVGSSRAYDSNGKLLAEAPLFARGSTASISADALMVTVQRLIDDVNERGWSKEDISLVEVAHVHPHYDVFIQNPLDQAMGIFGTQLSEGDMRAGRTFNSSRWYVRIKAISYSGWSYLATFRNGFLVPDPFSR